MPADWTVIPVPGGQDIGPAVAASADGTDFTAGFTTAGMLYVATKTRSPRHRLTVSRCSSRDGCTAEAIADYDDGVFKGRFQTFSQCAGTDSFYTVIIAKPPEENYTAIVEVQVPTAEDEAALEQIEKSFTANPDLF